MLTFLSDEWIGALHEAARADATLAECTRDVALTIEQEVTGAPTGDVRYHLVFDHGSVAVAPGPAANATVRFHQDYATAASIAMGQGSAQRAFMTGRLRVGGDLRALLAMLFPLNTHYAIYSSVWGGLMLLLLAIWIAALHSAPQAPPSR